MERDGTGGAEGHDAVDALSFMIGRISTLLDDSAGKANVELARYCGALARELVPAVRAVAHELRREHGDVPALRLAILELEQRLRDHPENAAPESV